MTISDSCALAANWSALSSSEVGWLYGHCSSFKFNAETTSVMIMAGRWNRAKSPKADNLLVLQRAFGVFSTRLSLGAFGIEGPDISLDDLGFTDVRAVFESSAQGKVCEENSGEHDRQLPATRD
jgi:hypothetical protein